MGRNPNRGKPTTLLVGSITGLLLFVTMAALAAGRYYGLDAVVERTEFVKQRPRLTYLLG